MRSSSWIVILLVALCAVAIVVTPDMAFAQDEGGGAPQTKAELEAAVVGTVIAGFMKDFKPSNTGAFLFQYMIVIILASGLAVAFERFFTIVIKAARVNGEKFTMEILSLVDKKDYDRAVQLCDQSPGGAIPVLTKVGLLAAQQQLGARAVQDAIDHETLMIMSSITKRLSWVSVLAGIATLAGLMGTIFGLMYTFAGLTLVKNPKAKADALAGGIATAMNTTLFGLIVAIPLTLIHQYLSQARQGLVDDIDENSVLLIQALTKG